MLTLSEFAFIGILLVVAIFANTKMIKAIKETDELRKNVLAEAKKNNKEYLELINELKEKINAVNDRESEMSELSVRYITSKGDEKKFATAELMDGAVQKILISKVAKKIVGHLNPKASRAQLPDGRYVYSYKFKIRRV